MSGNSHGAEKSLRGMRAEPHLCEKGEHPPPGGAMVEVASAKQAMALGQSDGWTPVVSLSSPKTVQLCKGREVVTASKTANGSAK